MTVPSWVEIQLAVGGVLRLACGDRSGLSFFDTTVEGFWRSFRSATICYPIYLLFLGFTFSAAQWTQYGVTSITLVETIRYVIAWVAFPLIVLPITDFFDRGGRFYSFMVVYNWSQLPQYVLFTVIALDGATGLLPPSAVATFQLAALIAVMIYEWYIGRITLNITGAQATLIVIVDQVLNTGLDRIARGLY